ncbi:MAG: hypothetical protein ACLTQI_00040 [Slackia sp.]
MVEDAERELLQAFFTQLQNQGATFDAYLKAQDITPEDFKEDVKLRLSTTSGEPCSRRMGSSRRHRSDRRDILDEFRTAVPKTPTRCSPSGISGPSAYRSRGIMRGKALEGPAQGSRHRRSRAAC